MSNMVEFKCWGKMDCGNQFLLRIDEDPTSSTGCCKVCGSNSWVIRETDLTEQAHFKHLLKSPELFLRYNIISDTLI